MVWPHLAKKKRSERGHPKLSRIRTKMDIKEGRQSRKSFYCRIQGHTINHCPNNPALRRSTSNYLLYVILLIVFNKFILIQFNGTSFVIIFYCYLFYINQKQITKLFKIQ